jgi:hypothetical protein
VTAAYAATVGSAVAVLRACRASRSRPCTGRWRKFRPTSGLEDRLIAAWAGTGPRRPGARRVRRRLRPLRQRQSTQKLRRHQPDHPGFRQKKIALARYTHNDGLVDALDSQAFTALQASPGARAYYGRLRTRDVGHHAALRQVANHLAGILHGCHKTGTLYDEAAAWPHHTKPRSA